MKTKNPCRCFAHWLCRWIFRSLSNVYQVMTEDGRAPILGRICMDMCMVDLTHCPNVAVGSEVEIFGIKNSANVMAQMAQTIPYEITCAVSKRVPRIYYRNGQAVERSGSTIDTNDGKAAYNAMGAVRQEFHAAGWYKNSLCVGE